MSNRKSDRLGVSREQSEVRYGCTGGATKADGKSEVGDHQCAAWLTSRKRLLSRREPWGECIFRRGHKKRRR